MLRRYGAKRKRYAKRDTRYRVGATGGGSQQQLMRVGPRAIAPNTQTTTIKRILTTMTSGAIGPLTIYTEAGGGCRWSCGGAAGDSLQLNFSLASTQLWIGGVVVTNMTNNGYLQQTASFQRYRIDRIEISMYVGANMTSLAGDAPVNALTQNAQPVIMYVVDSDDSYNLTASEILSYGNMHFCQPSLSDPLEVSFKPAAQANLSNVNPGTSSNAGTTFSPIISTDFPNTVHFGFKAVPTDFSSNPSSPEYQASCNFVIRYHCTFFDPK